MVSKKVVFDDGQIEYLTGLSAVRSATTNRIEYSDEFQKDCMERYGRGESPVKIFREAGLGPEIIGYKRIERCIARWKAAAARAAEAASESAGTESAAAEVAAEN
ncbi:transposase [Bifidobacterium hapali]|uniref:Transposase n=1 Tax=Bifidobacterium hapali TaxID=1630172 RepID=A0A261FWA7_9BIFI|nr:hypothetical protein [Bifidobacterium hapali]OZG63223.1 transposase [Bifidobacterium hapali]